MSTMVRTRFPRRAMLTGSAGFTLIEMLVVLVIIGLVMGLVGPQVLNYLSDARAKAARLQIQLFSTGLDLYYLDIGRYPPASEGLNALYRRPSGTETWNGPYLKGDAVPLDPWGRAYVYRAPAERAPYEIISLGADGNEGGTGAGSDIRSGQR
jgi:general secretion pathway protein G